MIDTANRYVRTEVGRVGCLARFRLHKADVAGVHAATARPSCVADEHAHGDWRIGQNMSGRVGYAGQGDGDPLYIRDAGQGYRHRIGGEGWSSRGSGSGCHTRVPAHDIVIEREDKRLSAGSVTAFYPGSARERQIDIEVSRASVCLPRNRAVQYERRSGGQRRQLEVISITGVIRDHKLLPVVRGNGRALRKSSRDRIRSVIADNQERTSDDWLKRGVHFQSAACDVHCSGEANLAPRRRRSQVKVKGGARFNIHRRGVTPAGRYLRSGNVHGPATRRGRAR